MHQAAGSNADIYQDAYMLFPNMVDYHSFLYNSLTIGYFISIPSGAPVYTFNLQFRSYLKRKYEYLTEIWTNCSFQNPAK